METKSCIVCGQGSTREDWINRAEVNGEEVVACDHHSKEEIAARVMGLSTKDVAEAQKTVVEPPVIPPAPTPAPAIPGTPAPTTAPTAPKV